MWRTQNSAAVWPGSKNHCAKGAPFSFGILAKHCRDSLPLQTASFGNRPAGIESGLVLNHLPVSRGGAHPHLTASLLQVVLHRGHHADGLHETAVATRIRRSEFAGLAGIASLICGQNRKYSLIRLPDRSDFTTRI